MRSGPDDRLGDKPSALGGLRIDRERNTLREPAIASKLVNEGVEGELKSALAFFDRLKPALGRVVHFPFSVVGLDNPTVRRPVGGGNAVGGVAP